MKSLISILLFAVMAGSEELAIDICKYKKDINAEYSNVSDRAKFDLIYQKEYSFLEKVSQWIVRNYFNNHFKIGQGKIRGRGQGGRRPRYCGCRKIVS